MRAQKTLSGLQTLLPENTSEQTAKYCNIHVNATQRGTFGDAAKRTATQTELQTAKREARYQPEATQSSEHKLHHQKLAEHADHNSSLEGAAHPTHATIFCIVWLRLKMYTLINN